MSVIDDFADKLTSQGVATTGTNLFKHFMPLGPDEMLGLFATGGPAPIDAMGASGSLPIAERPHVQVMGRSGRPSDAMYLVQKAYRHLHNLGPVTINGVIYRHITALQGPFFLYTDETGRYIYACNFEAIRDAATSS